MEDVRRVRQGSSKALVPVFIFVLVIITSIFGCHRSHVENAEYNLGSPRASPTATSADRQKAEAAPDCVDLNTAGPEQLTTLPGIGVGLAARIIQYRQGHGPFRRPQDIIIINGFGERRYHKLEPFVCGH